MSYTVIDFKTKKALKEAFARGEQIEVYQPRLLGPKALNGVAHLEGPHYPEPHTWNATAIVKDNIIIRLET